MVHEKIFQGKFVVLLGIIVTIFKCILINTERKKLTESTKALGAFDETFLQCHSKR